MELYDLITLAQDFKDLGWSVQEQLMTVLDDSDKVQECNPNAIEMIVVFLERCERLGVDAGWPLSTCREFLAGVPACGNPGPDCEEHQGACD
jgi:hypothetical protein